MRPLTEEETKIFFEKLTKYIGENVRMLLDRSDGLYCFRLHRDRVYYCKEDIMKKAAHFPRKQLISFGTCFGRFSKTKKFRLNVYSLRLFGTLRKNTKCGSSQAPSNSSCMDTMCSSQAWDESPMIRRNIRESSFTLCLICRWALGSLLSRPPSVGIPSLWQLLPFIKPTLENI